MRLGVHGLFRLRSVACGILAALLVIGSALVFVWPRISAWREGTPARNLVASDSTVQPHLAEAYGKMPLSFERNQGQADTRVRFISRGRGYTLFLAPDQAVLAFRKPATTGREPLSIPGSIAQHAGLKTAPSPLLLPALNPFGADPIGEKIQVLGGPTTRSSTLRIKVLGSNPATRISGVGEVPGESNYFIGNDPKRWRTHVPNYASVKYQDVYPGIDFVYYGHHTRQLAAGALEGRYACESMFED